jgi:hypothetical protein
MVRFGAVVRWGLWCDGRCRWLGSDGFLIRRSVRRWCHGARRGEDSLQWRNVVGSAMVRSIDLMRSMGDFSMVIRRSDQLVAAIDSMRFNGCLRLPAVVGSAMVRSVDSKQIGDGAERRDSMARCGSPW